MRRSSTAAATIQAIAPFENLFDVLCEEFIGVEGGGVLRMDEGSLFGGRVGVLSIPYNDQCHTKPR